MAKHRQSHTEQAANPTSSTRRAAQAAPRHPYNPVFCLACPAMRPDPYGEYTSRVLRRAEHPLISYAKLLTWDGGVGDNSTSNDLFLAWLDKEKRPRARRREDAIQVVMDFAAKWPLLADLALESIVRQRSRRDIADELGITHPTVGTMLDRAQSLLHEAATVARLYEVAC